MLMEALRKQSRGQSGGSPVQERGFASRCPFKTNQASGLGDSKNPTSLWQALRGLLGWSLTEKAGLEGARPWRKDSRALIPEPPVLCCCAAGDDLGDEDAGVVPNVGVVGASGDAEAQAGVALKEGESPRRQGQK